MPGMSILCFALLAGAPGLGPDAMDAYRAAAAKTGRDAGAHVNLALWCERHGLRTLGELVGARLMLRIAGHMDAPHEQRLRERLASSGLSDNVQIYGRTPRPEALRLLARSDLSLVLAQEQPTQVPAKIYEAVAMSVPTLVITEPGSAAAHEACRIGALTIENEDVAGMRRILDDIVDGRFPARIDARAPISYEELAGQMEQVLAGAAARARAGQPQ